MPIHSSAIVDPTAQIASDATISPFAVIGPDVRIGPGCKIHPHTVIEYTTLGTNCEVFPGASIGLAPQHLRYKGEPARVVVGSGSIFREGVTVHRGSPFDHSVTTIGDNCFFMATSHVAHDARMGNNVILANGAIVAGHCEVGDNAFISGVAGLHQFVRVGKGAIVSGGSMVPLDVAPFCMAQGDRAQIRGLNIVGMRRLGFDRATIKEVKTAFKVLFLNGLLLAEALDRPELNTGSDAITTFREFLRSSKRGFMRTAGGWTEKDSDEAEA